MKKFLSIFLLVFLATDCVAQVASPLWKTLPGAPAMPRADRSGLAPVNDIQMYYGIFNQGGRAPVILLHGALVSSDEWGFEVPLLSRTHKVIVVDSRGHGRSTMSNQPFSYDLLASDILQLMDYLHIRKASIVGWSDGGIIGLILAMNHPERVNKLFTFGANYNQSGYKSEPVDSALSAAFMARVQSNYRKLSATPDSFFVFRKALVKMYSKEPNLDTNRLKKIKAPTVIAAGEYEQFITREHFENLARLIPNATLLILPNVSHGGPLQDPARFHEAVIKLIDK